LWSAQSAKGELLSDLRTEAHRQCDLSVNHSSQLIASISEPPEPLTLRPAQV
jgi:hypothetical protein